MTKIFFKTKKNNQSEKLWPESGVTSNLWTVTTYNTTRKQILWTF